VLSSAINSHLSSSSAPQRLPLPPLPHDQTTTAATLHGVGAIQQRREELQRLAKELCGGQLRSQHMWDQLEQAQEQHRRQVAQLKREVEEARSEAAAAATAVHNAQRAKEQAELHDKLADALAQLAATKVDLQASRQAVESSKSRISEVETTVAELTDELTSAKAALQQKEALLLAQQKERSVCQGELTMLKAAHQEDTGALQDAARELLCLRVEKTMAGLSAVYQEAKAAKADLLEREGYRHL
jgi:chromosome segregation ATPase